MRDETLGAVLTESLFALAAGTFPDELRPRLAALGCVLHRRGRIEPDDLALTGYVPTREAAPEALQAAHEDATLFAEIERLLRLHGPEFDSEAAEVALEDIGLALLREGRELEVDALQAIASGHRYVWMLATHLF